MKKKVASLTSISILIFSLTLVTQSIKPVNADPSIIKVPDDYEKIQWAVDNATAGDTILVATGTYYEQVTIEKPLTLIGENTSTTIIDGSLQRYVIKCFNTNYVNIMGFTIKNAIHGINLTYSTNITISNNIIVNNIQFGVFLLYSSNNTIENNTISENGDRGIYLRNLSSNNIVSNNTISNHREYGIYVYNVSTNNIISNNKILDNREISPGVSAYGINLRDESAGNTISDNVISNNTYGISIQYSPGNTLKNNDMTGNDYNFDIRAFALGQYVQNIDTSNTINGKPMYYWINQDNKQVPAGAGYVAAINSQNITVKGQTLINNSQGVLFAYTTNSTIINVNALYNNIGIHVIEELYIPPKSSNNTIKDNILANNYEGIEFTFSNGNTFTGNTVTKNYYGVNSAFCNNTLYHNNFIDNINLTYRNIPEIININIWDNGYPTGGNYWSDYNGTDLYSGPYQNETDSDGIGDTPYGIDENNIDNYPLMNPWGPLPPPGPTADFTYVPLFPQSNEAITFDASASQPGFNGTHVMPIVSYAWNFSDGSPIVIATEPITTHKFTAEGNYTVTLNVTDTQGFWNTTSKRVTVEAFDITAPVADAGPDQMVNEDTLVTFDGSNSSDNVGIINYIWTFTDVTPRTLTGVSPTYNFTNPGVFTVTLNVSDAAGNGDTDTFTMTIRDVTPPVADAGSNQTVEVKTIVTFDASGSSDNVGVVSYEWDFGDGTNGSGVTTNHSYTKPGIYTVTLKVKDAANNSATDSIAVTVVSIPFPWWIAGLLAAAGILAAIVAYLVKVRKRAKT